MRAKKLLLFFSIILIILSIINVSALTARVYNSKMVIRAVQGDVIERSITIENANDVPVLINAVPSGDLVEYLILEKNNFTMRPGEKIDLDFKLTVVRNGTTETRIIFLFTALEGREPGVALPSDIVVIANTTEGYEYKEPTSFGEKIKNLFRNEDNEISEVNESEEEKVGEEESEENNEYKPNYLLITLSLTTLILVIILIWLFVYWSKLNKKAKKETKLKKSDKKNV